MQKSKKNDVQKSIKCVKCDFENPANMKFCGNCGAKLSVTPTTPEFEGLTLLHITGSAYLLISLIFNTLVKDTVLVVPYLASGLLGLYAGYEFYKGKTGMWSKIISILAIVMGVVSTSYLFWMGLELRGVIGPAWVIFLISAWLLWKDRGRL